MHLEGRAICLVEASMRIEMWVSIAKQADEAQLAESTGAHLANAHTFSRKRRRGWPGFSATTLAGVLLAAACNCSWALASDQRSVGQAGHGAEDAAWNNLTSTQKESLAPLRPQWASLEQWRRDKWLRIAGRMRSMTVDERRRIQERMRDWAGLSQKQRSEARLRYADLGDLSSADRQRRWEAFQALSRERQQALRSRAGHTDRDDGKPRISRPLPLTVTDPSRPPPVQLQHRAAIGPALVQAQRGATTTPIVVRHAPVNSAPTGIRKEATRISQQPELTSIEPR
ncbi:MAG: DUF3106 domain-containing protein [Burkholderiales bacterium]